jgi:hypothetical protein
MRWGLICVSAPLLMNTCSNRKAELTRFLAMFEPKENPGYETMSNEARDMITGWLQNSEWYRSAGAIRPQ